MISICYQSLKKFNTETKIHGDEKTILLLHKNSHIIIQKDD